MTSLFRRTFKRHILFFGLPSFFISCNFYWCYDNKTKDVFRKSEATGISDTVNVFRLDEHWVCHGFSGWKRPDAETCGYGPHIQIDLRASNKSNFKWREIENQPVLEYHYQKETYYFTIFSVDASEVTFIHECQRKRSTCYEMMWYQIDDGKTYYYTQ